MLLTPYGFREWFSITLVAVVLAAAFLWLGWWWASIPVAFAWIALLSFFRDPVRRVPAGLPDGAMLSPADGTISAVLTVDAHEATGGRPAAIVRIFLSVLNVHINRAPCDGRIMAVQHRPGCYFDARTPESAARNESNLIIMQITRNRMIGIRQVSGKLARRIVCRARVGDDLRRGQRFGMIKFGSTTELILPASSGVEVHVRVGERVKGGRTVLATLDGP
jgi:phosphatidylserine decarboxylase